MVPWRLLNLNNKLKMLAVVFLATILHHVQRASRPPSS